MIETRAPGKLFVAGEYAVVEPGEPAVLIAVDRYLRVRLSEGAGAGRVHSTEYGRAPLVWTRDDRGAGIVLEHHPYDYVVAAIAAAEELRADRGLPPRYFDLHIESQLDDVHGRKFGLGSSAAVTVAVIDALNTFHGLGLTRLERFRLALLATITIAPAASGGDLAASTFGGWIRYSSPDRQALRTDRSAHGVARAMESDGWAPCRITRLPDPDRIELIVGWTGSPASTERLVSGVRQPRGNPEGQYPSFLDDSRECVDALVASLENHGEGALPVTRLARRVLQRLGTASGIQIETGKLRALCDIAERYDAAAKPSGAGGGDCGIGFVNAGGSQRDILREWEANDIRRLSLSVHPAEGGADD